MRIQLAEPLNPRYIHINAATNKIHLLVPIVGGEEISRDNTCKVKEALQEFFDGNAILELYRYKKALAVDIILLDATDPLRIAKEDRLAQIEAYRIAIRAMQHSYGDAIKAFQAKPSNLYSIQLRPRAQDISSVVVNPIFNIERTNDATGNPLSALYNTMHSLYPTVTIAITDPRTTLKAAVLAALPTPPTFDAIQAALSAESLKCFNLTINFSQNTKGDPVSKEAIDRLMGFGADATPDNYMDALLGVCARDMQESIPTPIFYSIPSATPVSERTERLSIMTQFFLANLNVYCKARNISSFNFGTVLDASDDLSLELVRVVTAALAAGHDVEALLCDFINTKAAIFGFTRPLSSDDIRSIKQQFERIYRTVTATIENPHMDDFMILDKEATGEKAKCVTHQNAICVNFAEILDPVTASVNTDYFESIRIDFAVHPAEIPHRNASIGGADVEIPIERLSRLSHKAFKWLPVSAQEACRAHPIFQIRYFLDCVAQGITDKINQTLIKTKAEAILKDLAPENRQSFLLTPVTFTDDSDRTFNCTAFEYSYWAKDTHMCKTLISYMDENTKAQMLARVTANDSEGLRYEQNHTEHRSAHFDLTPLKSALQTYIREISTSNESENWMAIGKAQRDVPVHIAQPYCGSRNRPDGLEPELVRTLKFYNCATSATDFWFPLQSSTAGLGFDFAIYRGKPGQRARADAGLRIQSPDKRFAKQMQIELDLEYIKRLDLERTAELLVLRNMLNRPARTSSYCLVM